MKKIVFLSLSVLFILGCSGQSKNEGAIAKVNNYEISLDEFNADFQDSFYGRADGMEAKKDYLNNLINRKLILQDAQAKGLDKQKDFLRLIEKYWEQSLLKVALDKKTKEIAGSAQVSDKSIEEAYNKMVKEGRTDMTYDQMYNQIKWEITKLKESEAMNTWIADLREKSHIKVNYDLLKDAK